MNKRLDLAQEAGFHLDVDTARYLSLSTPPERIRDRLAIEVSPHSFLPEVEDLRRDWVASVAVPAFKLIRERQGVQRAFCSIGTGSGLDALAAIETLGSTRIGITDVHEDVVRCAADNIRRNLKASHPVKLEAGYGDLFSPLRDYRPRYELVYENLPNVPIADEVKLAEARVSSSHLAPRVEAIPELVKTQLLALHYLALRQAHEFLAPGGAVLSMLGSRIPLSVYRELARLAGHRGEIYTYGWKLQADAEAVIEGHAQQQRAGYGPFHFYPVERLEKAFEAVPLADSGRQAFEIEASLAPHRLDPAAALDALQRGEPVGHTVAVLRSTPEEEA